MELFEPAIILGIVIGVSSLFMAWHKQRISNKTTSVTISLEMSKRFKEKDFQNTIEFLYSGEKPDDSWDEKIEIEKLLTHFEDMGLYEDEGVLKMKHIDQMYRDTLIQIKKSKIAQDIIKESQKKDSEFYFIFLKKILEQYD